MPLSEVIFSLRDQDRAGLAGSREQIEKTKGGDQNRLTGGSSGCTHSRLLLPLRHDVLIVQVDPTIYN